MTLSRRRFLWTAAASSVCLPGLLEAQAHPSNLSAVFRHGVASGDPLDDRVILWTRVTPPAAGAPRSLEVRWVVTTDEQLTRVVRRGTARASADRDYTVKVDAAGLDEGRVYFYAFEAGGERSRVGRTRTLPNAAERVRLALVCCSNYPAGYFNVYACLATHDLDAVVHVGDYIYEFENGIYGDGSSMLRIPEPRRETITLTDYRVRYATYRTDLDLQEAHARHPFILVWDDHELTNDAWSAGAGNHNPEKGEGDWPTRRAAAYRAYVEWMPIREANDGDIHLYRSFRFGSVADLLMLDTRGLRDQQVAPSDIAALTREQRSLLGSTQERWLFDRLRSSQRSGTRWRILGQQVMFSRLALPGRPVVVPDAWDGYQAARERVLECLDKDRIADVAILSGDIHSSWAFDVPRNAWDGYNPATGAGSLAVEIVTPAISSPPLFTNPVLRAGEAGLRASLPHLRFLEGESNGYTVLDVSSARLQSDWYVVPTVARRSDQEKRVKRLVTERGSARLAEG